MQPIVSRCPQTQALVFTPHPLAVAAEAKANKQEEENAALKKLLGQLVSAQSDTVRKKLDPELLAILG